MAVTLVSYELDAPGQNYAGLISAVQRYTHCKSPKSAWLTDTPQSPIQVRYNLRQHIDKQDALAATMFGKGDWSMSV